MSYLIGEWILITFPQDETGKRHKLSRPRHGPCRITTLTQTDVTAVKMYYPKEGTVQVHMNGVVIRDNILFVSGGGRHVAWGKSHLPLAVHETLDTLKLVL